MGYYNPFPAIIHNIHNIKLYMEKMTFTFEVAMVTLVLVSLASFIIGLFLAPDFFNIVGLAALVLLGVVATAWICYILYSYSRW